MNNKNNEIPFTREQLRKIVLFAVFMTVAAVMMFITATVWAIKYNEVEQNNINLTNQVATLQNDLDKSNSEVVSLQYQLDESKK